VNGIANILTTAAIDVRLDLDVKLDLNSNLWPKVISGDFPITRQNVILVGQVRYGQTVDILIEQDPSKLSKKMIKNINVTYQMNGKKF
jgi:hypothetical protein